MSWVAAGVAGGTIVGGMLASKSSQGLRDQEARAAGTQADISLDQWNLFKSGGLPLLQSLSKRAQEDRTAEETNLASGDVKDQYATARANALRRLNLEGGGDNSDRAAAILGPSYMDEAAQTGRAISTARRAERQRQTNEQAAVASGYQGFPAQAISAAGGAASSFRGLAQDADARASQGVYGTVVLGANARRWFGGSRGGNPGGGTGTMGDTGDFPQAGEGDTFAADGGVIEAPYAEGGWIKGAIRHPGALHRDLGIPEGQKIPHHLVEAAAQRGGEVGRRARLALTLGGMHGHADGGVISGPGTGTSDSISANVRPNTYILSADTVRAIGHKKVDELISKAGVRPGRGGTSYNGVPVRVSTGEAEIPPEAVAYHGEDFFHKLQEKYHRPVMSDGSGGHANGGVIRKRGLPKSVEDAIFNAMPGQAIGKRRST